MKTNPLATIWNDRATVYEYKDTVDPETFQSTQTLEPVLVDEPCRISFRQEQATNIRSGAAVISQSITLFISPYVYIKPGSVIDVNHYGTVTRFKGSSKAALYSNHQQIVLELYEENA